MKIKVSREFKIGFFGVLMILLLYWGINFLRGQDLFTRSNTYYACYDQVNGIQTSSPIVIRGFKVGTVAKMSYDPSRSSKIILEFNIKSKFRIPENSTARVFSDGFLGNKAIEIDLGNSTKYLEDGDTLSSQMEKNFMEVAGNEFDFFKQRVATITDNLTVTLENLNALLTENRSGINTTVGNLADISGNLNFIVKEERDDIRDIVANIKELSVTLKNNSGKIDSIIANTSSFTDSLSRTDIPGTVDELNGVLARLNQTLDKINDGKGSAGMLINDRSLYDSLVAASGNLSMLLEDIKLHPKRYINVTVFGRKSKDE